MNEPVLVIMAAGMGSRYGGLKQMDPMDEMGHLIVDYSIYDAVQAGFEEVIFVLKKENEQLFREKIGDRISQFVRVRYVYQDLYDLPEGFSVPEGRVKPWGTGHAVLSCILSVVDRPFAVINADDYYGKEAFRKIYRFLRTHGDDESQYRYAMVAYQLKNTVTEHGSVSRGVCTEDKDGCLVGITERTCIEKHGADLVFTEDSGNTWTVLAPDTPVSMNMWGFNYSMMNELLQRFPKFLEKGLKENPLKCEYFLPFVVDELLKEGKARVDVLKTPDKWYGVTYREDKEEVVRAFREMREAGAYPAKLWEQK